MPASIYHNNNLKGSGSTREYQEPFWTRTALEAGQQRELSPSSASGAPPPQRDCCLQGGECLSVWTEPRGPGGTGSRQSLVPISPSRVKFF